MKVAVIGAGWAGLAAAVELTAQGSRVTLFEAGRVAGGRARSSRIDGRALDNGQHILLGAYRETLALMARVGADPARCLVRTPLQLGDLSGFRFALPRLPVPWNLAWGLLCARGVGWQEKWRTARWMNTLTSRQFRLGTDTCVSDWLDGAGQTGILRQKLWEPLCLAALNTPANRASAQVFANVLRDSLGSPERDSTDLLLPRVLLGEVFPDPAVRWLEARGAELRFGQRVRAIEGTRVDGQDFDAVILAVAPQHVASLLPAEAPCLAYEPICTIYLQFPHTIRLPFPMVHLAGKYGPWVVDREKGLLACVISGQGDWQNEENDPLVSHVVALLRHGLGELPAPEWQAVIREKRATFSCTPHCVRRDHRTAHPAVFLAGDHVWAEYPGTLEGAVRSGLAAAHAALQAAGKRPS